MSKISARPKPGFKTTVTLLIIATLALFAGSAYYWYNNVILDPQRTLTGMLDKSLQTTSVQRSVTQNSGGQGGVVQSVYVGFSPKVISQSMTRLEENSQLGSTKVNTEMLGMKNADYVRYNSIEVSGKTPKNADKVIGVWGKRGGDAESGQPATFLDEALLSAVPFGNLSASQRKDIMAEIDKVKLYEYSKAEVSYKSGRPVITYTTELDPKSLVQVLAKYVEVTGVGSSQALNPANYENVQKVKIKIDVDALSRHLRSVEFAGSGRLETYKGYNSARKVEVPNQTISVDELQTRLQSIEQQQ